METIIMIDWLRMHDYDTFILPSLLSVIFESIIFFLKENLKFEQCMEQLLSVSIISCYNFLSNISTSRNTANPFRILK